MTYPCGIIRDLLPLYIDDVCNEESRIAVSNHLSECEKCSGYYESMKSTEGLIEKQTNSEEDVKMANSLKNIKKKLNKRVKISVISSLSAAAVLFFVFQLLFHLPLKNVDVSDVSVSANVYSLNKLANDTKFAEAESASTTVFADENDESKTISITIPEIGDISLTQNTIDKSGYATVISWNSDYFLREISYAEQNNNSSDILYVSEFKTTFLDNKAEEYQKKIINLEFKQINKIVYVTGNGTEKVLWENENVITE